MPYFVYILHSEKFDRFYKGQTNNVADRLARHNRGSEKATAPYRPWKVVWFAEKPSWAEAVELELKLKNLSRQRTRAFIKKHTPGRS